MRSLWGDLMTPQHSHTPTHTKEVWSVFFMPFNGISDCVVLNVCDLQCEEACAGRGAETNWTERVQQILQQQV